MSDGTIKIIRPSMRLTLTSFIERSKSSQTFSSESGWEGG
jgi:hypothetical protein